MCAVLATVLACGLTSERGGAGTHESSAGVGAIVGTGTHENSSIRSQKL